MGTGTGRTGPSAAASRPTTPAASSPIHSVSRLPELPPPFAARTKRRFLDFAIVFRSFAGPKAGFVRIKNPVPGQGTGYGTRGTTLVDDRSSWIGPARAHKKSRPQRDEIDE